MRFPFSKLRSATGRRPTKRGARHRRETQRKPRAGTPPLDRFSAFKAGSPRDFGRVDFLTSNALDQLIRLRQRVRAGAGRLNLCNVSPPVHEVFEITRFHTIMEIIPPSSHWS